MGFSISVLAVRGPTQQQVLARLSLAPATRSVRGHRKKIFIGSSGDWVILEANDFMRFGPETLATVSAAGAEAMAWSIEEHVMVSQAWGYRNGREVWSIAHDCEKCERHLAVTGEPPPHWPGVRAKIMETQDAYDAEVGVTDDLHVDGVFDAPMDLAEALTGYRHDLRLEEWPEVTRVRAPGRPGLSGMLGAFFGR